MKLMNYNLIAAFSHALGSSSGSRRVIQAKCAGTGSLVPFPLRDSLEMGRGAVVQRRIGRTRTSPCGEIAFDAYWRTHPTRLLLLQRAALGRTTFNREGATACPRSTSSGG
jgi:hypothetical protein